MKILRRLFKAISKKLFKRKQPRRRHIPHRKFRVKKKQRPVSLRKIFRPRKKPTKTKIKHKKKSARRPSGAITLKRPKVSLKSAIQKAAKPAVKNEFVGEITHYFSKIKVCVIHVKGASIAVGDRLEFQGHTTRFLQTVQSLQIESSDVKSAHRDQMVGMKVAKKCRAGDRAFKIIA